MVGVVWSWGWKHPCLRIQFVKVEFQWFQNHGSTTPKLLQRNPRKSPCKVECNGNGISRTWNLGKLPTRCRVWGPEKGTVGKDCWPKDCQYLCLTKSLYIGFVPAKMMVGRRSGFLLEAFRPIFRGFGCFRECTVFAKVIGFCFGGVVIPLIFPNVPQSSQTESLGFPSYPPPWTQPYGDQVGSLRLFTTLVLGSEQFTSPKSNITTEQ